MHPRGADLLVGGDHERDDSHELQPLEVHLVQGVRG